MTAGSKFLQQPFSSESEVEIQSEIPEEPEMPGWLRAVRAAESKKATEIKVLDLTEVTTFTDFFIICNGANSRQMQAITDEISLQLKRAGEPAISIEGYDQADWILSDYSDFIVHVFSDKTRAFYDLDRLWRQGKTVEIPAESPAPAE